jgi:DNA polymerase
MVNMLIHDEILCEVKEEEAEAMLAKITDIMCQGPEWSEGLPINAEGYISRRYKK